MNIEYGIRKRIQELDISISLWKIETFFLKKKTKLLIILGQAINAKFLSLDYKNLKAEIKTADAQESHMGGVTVLVTGYLTGMDNVRRPFAQSFFLAPQDKGYFVLNDVFRYMDECEFVENSSTMANGVSETAPKAPQIPDPGNFYFFNMKCPIIFLHSIVVQMSCILTHRQSYK